MRCSFQYPMSENESTQLSQLIIRRLSLDEQNFCHKYSLSIMLDKKLSSAETPQIKAFLSHRNDNPSPVICTFIKPRLSPVHKNLVRHGLKSCHRYQYQPQDFGIIIDNINQFISSYGQYQIFILVISGHIGGIDIMPKYEQSGD